jgi:hypothetical protein
LGINQEGWISSEFYEERFPRNQELRWNVTEMGEEEFKTEIWKIWPYKDDEDSSEWKDQEHKE